MKLKENIKGIAHIGIPTNDMDRTIEFYKQIGFDLIMETVNEAANERVSFLRAKSLVIETYENKQAVMADGAIDHIAVDVDDIEAVYQFLTENEFEITTLGIEFLPFWENGVKFCKIAGPNRESIEFCQRL